MYQYFHSVARARSRVYWHPLLLVCPLEWGQYSSHSRKLLLIVSFKEVLQQGHSSLLIYSLRAFPHCQNSAIFAETKLSVKLKLFMTWIFQEWADLCFGDAQTFTLIFAISCLNFLSRSVCYRFSTLLRLEWTQCSGVFLSHLVIKI